MALIGYARVSSKDQKLDSQIDQLKNAGCTRIFQEKVSSVASNRPEWDKCLDYLRDGDVLIVTELSRMTRSLTHLLKISQQLEKNNISFSSLRESIETSSATGKAFFHIIGAINQMERELKAERASAGRAAAKARGRSGGRPQKDQKIMAAAAHAYKTTNQTSAEVCKMFGIGRRTLYNYIKKTEDSALKQES